MQNLLIVSSCLLALAVLACALLAREAHRLRAHAAGLERQAAEDAEAENERRQFAYAASHDLQAPLRKTAAFATLLRGRLGSRLDAEDSDLLNRMTGSLEEMQALIDSLLKLSRVSSGGPSIDVNLSALAADVAKELGGEVRVAPLPSVKADPAQMRLLLQNLIGNALKFRRPGQPPAVRVRGGSLDDGLCELIVEDDGVGFDMRHASRLFQPFQRLHGKAQFPGSGLGLAICERIVARHGGRISAQSVEGRGSMFRVVLPGGARWNA